MGKLEAGFRHRKKRADIQKLILSTVAAAGLISAALVAPGVLRAIQQSGLVPKRRQEDIIRRSQQRLVERGFLVWEGKRLRLTKQGERRCRLIEALDYPLAKPARWDGRWRVLIFDIPERRKSLREKVRTTLRAVGFIRLQDSVWIYPYDCEDLIVLLKADFKIGRDMLYMIVDMLEHDAPIRTAFGLKT